MALKVKPTDAQSFKTFEINVKKFDWKSRCDINNRYLECEGNVPSFEFWGNIIIDFTDIKEDELNDYSNDEIMAICTHVYEYANSKKK